METLRARFIRVMVIGVSGEYIDEGMKTVHGQRATMAHGDDDAGVVEGWCGRTGRGMVWTHR